MTTTSKTRFIVIADREYLIDTDEDKQRAYDVMRANGIEGGRIREHVVIESEYYPTVTEVRITDELLMLPESPLVR